jgi:NAD(P)-dependent dehydrogenase (short-subunit alcohol dehydrogenase family)
VTGANRGLGLAFVQELIATGARKVIRQAISAIETDRDEVLADEIARQVKAGLSKEPGIYLNFDPGRDLANAAKA